MESNSVCNHNCYNFRENKINAFFLGEKALGKISLAETLSSVTNLSILENPQFGRVSVVVTTVIVITSVIHLILYIKWPDLFVLCRKVAMGFSQKAWYFA